MYKKLNILVIDDVKIIADFFEYTLGLHGHRITFAESALRAFEAVRHNSFDIVFLDIVMPHIDGVQTFKTICSLKPDLPIVVISGYSTEAKRKEIIELGAVACLVKPFYMDDIKQIIHGVLGVEA